MRCVATGTEARLGSPDVKANSLPNCVVIRSIALQGSPTAPQRVPYFSKLGAARVLSFVKILRN